MDFGNGMIANQFVISIFLLIALFSISNIKCNVVREKLDEKETLLDSNKLLIGWNNHLVGQNRKEDIFKLKIDSNKKSIEFKSDLKWRKSTEEPTDEIKTDLKRLRRSILTHNGRSGSKSLSFCKFKIQSTTEDLVYECKPVRLWKRREFLFGKINGTKQSHFFNSTNQVSDLSNASSHWLIPNNVTFLRLHHQNIGMVGANSFSFLHNTLRHLVLDANVITKVSENAFSGLSELVELDLSRNQIHTLPRNIFSDLKHLRILNLAHNQIDYVGEGFLTGLRSLSYLDLSYNAILDINEDAFNEVHTSRSLVVNLRRNKLTRPRNKWLVQSKSYRSSNENQESDSSLDSTDDPEKIERTRIFWGEENPWLCQCSSSFDSIMFLQTLLQIRFPDKNFLATTKNEKLKSFILKEQNPYKMEVDAIIPCSDLSYNDTPIELGEPLKAAKIINKTCCSGDMSQRKDLAHDVSCQILFKWLERNNETTKDDLGISNSQVTVIGILIVVLCPILLTLCPDCNQMPKNYKGTNRQRHASQLTIRSTGFLGGRSSFLFSRSLSRQSKT